MTHEELLRVAIKLAEELNADSGVGAELFRVLDECDGVCIEMARLVRLPFDESTARRWKEIDSSDLFEQTADP